MFCLSPASGGESVPGDLKDISPEELRWERMKARIDGTSEKLEERVQQLKLDYKVNTYACIYLCDPGIGIRMK